MNMRKRSSWYNYLVFESDCVLLGEEVGPELEAALGADAMTVYVYVVTQREDMYSLQ